MIQYIRNYLLTLVFCIIATCGSTVMAWDVPNETLTYDVMYKWGLINKKAGSVSLTTTRSSSEKFRANLTGATAPWADRFYKVRDTLQGTIDRRTFLPYKYRKVSYEGGDFGHDELSFTRSNNITKASVVHRTKHKKDTEETVITKELQATGPTVDMLSSFYYMRQLDYASMEKGHTVKLNVFSGRQKEILTIHFVGVEDVTIKKSSYPTYHITFTFTSGEGTKTSDNMDAWISTTASRIPLLMEGKLPIGKIRCFYSGVIPTK
jgi:hypothetical protein